MRLGLRREGLFASAVLSSALLCSALLAGAAQRAQPPAWTGWTTRGPEIVDSSGNNVVPKGFGPGEWTNTEAYMLHWPDQDPGNGKHAAQYGYTTIHKTLRRIMSAGAAAEYWRLWRANDVTETDFARMQAWGANSLRLSINYHWLSPAPGVYLASGWRWLDDAVSWGRAHGIRIIFCMHAAPGAQSGYLMADAKDSTPRLWTDPSKYQPWTIELWRAIARRYASEPFVAGYDLLDEPVPPKGQEGLVRPFYVTLARAIRSVDTNHILFVEGLNFAGSFKGMRAMLPPFDGNMVLVFHKYWDRNDQASIQGYVDVRSAYGVPLWNGETGENTSVWLHDMAQLLARNNIGWNSWTYKKLDSVGSVAYNVHEPAEYGAILKYVRCLTPTHRDCARPAQSLADATMLAVAHNDATNQAVFQWRVIRSLFGSAPSLALSVVPLARTVFRGSAATFALRLEAFGALGPMAFSAVGLPARAWVWFYRSAPPREGVAMLRVGIAPTTPAGSYPLSVVARGANGVMQTVRVDLTVAPATF